MSKNTNTATHALRERRLSSDRLAPYVFACGDDQAHALRLYEWNIELSGALYEALAVVEVVVRNVIHDELTAWHTSRGLPGTWLDDPQRQLGEPARRDLAKAKERAQQWRTVRGVREATRPDPPPGAIIAELSFGFWSFLLAAQYEHTLWTPSIRHGFPGTNKRELVQRPLRRLHQIRNRIAHLEPVHARNHEADERDMHTVLHLACPETANWARSMRRIAEIASKRP
ncbi:Abi family protein [Allokutzneria sp. NRRL B-24872]|uniref:Abi family protein n=1 Tax=Allokutzneria sp. NRRL B-24872 TaxID=1137961 RepID=UPI0011786D16|nr:Abi family protein [Allokutzneria sp. NRRL B-24872]